MIGKHAVPRKQRGRLLLLLLVFTKIEVIRRVRPSSGRGVAAPQLASRRAVLILLVLHAYNWDYTQQHIVIITPAPTLQVSQLVTL